MSTDVEIIETKEKFCENYLHQLKSKLREKGLTISFEDKFLVKFLRSRVYKIDETCSLIINYVSNFKKYPSYFENIRFARIAIEAGFFEILPHRNVTGEVIAIMRVGKWEPNETSFASLIASTVYAFEMAQLDEEAQKYGAIEIIDFSNVKWKQFLYITVSDIKIMSNMTESSLPIRWRKIFVVFQNRFTDLVYTIAKPFLSQEFKQLISFLGTDVTALHDVIPPDLLPDTYGGNSNVGGSIEFYKVLESIEPQLLEMWKPFKSVAM